MDNLHRLEIVARRTVVAVVSAMILALGLDGAAAQGVVRSVHNDWQIR